MYSFLKKEDIGSRKQVTFIGKEMKIYLPNYYTEEGSRFATRLGNSIETLGLFWFSVDSKFYELQLPVRISFEYQEEDTFRGKLKPELPEEKYNVYILRSGDAFIKNLQHKEAISELELMLVNIIGQGKMPLTVAYDKTINILLNLLTASGLKTKGGLSSAMYEMLLAEIYRNKHNPNQPFRMLINNSKSATMYDFKAVRLARIGGLQSTFNALTGEDVSQQITNMVTRTREGIEDRPAPLEKLIKL